MRAGLLALALLAAAAPAQAAPVKPKTPLPPLEQFLLDDADFVAVVDVKQVVGTPLFTKHFRKMTEAALKTEPAQKFLKGAGFDPLKDVMRVVVCMGRSCFEGPRAGSNDGPVFLLQGKFDAAKLHAKMAMLAKDGGVKVHDEKAGKVYELGGEYFAALVDKGATVFLAPRKALVEDALAKGAGTKKTKLKYAKELAPALKGFTPDVALQAVGLESMVLGVEARGGGGAPAMREYWTLGSSGLKGLRVSVTAKDDARGSVVLTGKDKADFGKRVKAITAGLEEWKQLLSKAPAKEVKYLVAFLEGVKAKTEKGALTFEGKADAETVKGIVELMTSGKF